MEHIDFVYDPISKYKSTSNDNVVSSDPSTAKMHEALADELLELFPPQADSDIDTTRLFFLKATYRLPEPRLRSLVVDAKEKGRGNGGALFNWLVRKESGLEWNRKQGDDN